MTGKVDTFFPLRGFGFLSSIEAGIRTTYFFHISKVIQGEPTPGAPVEFEIGVEEKQGKTAPAVNIKVGVARS
jgi:cold shock CspA family protein